MEKFKEKILSLLKSRKFWGVVASIAVMAIVAFAYFYPDDMDGRVLQQHDMRQGLANGHGTQSYPALDQLAFRRHAHVSDIAILSLQLAL